MQRNDRLHGSVDRVANADRRKGGSVVTYAVAGFMLVALAVYLATAYFADEPAEVESGAPAVGGPAADGASPRAGEE
jgi:hypothetical protein